MKENIAFPFFRQHICKIFVINAISEARILILVIFEDSKCFARFEIKFLRNHWKCVHAFTALCMCLLCCKLQALNSLSALQTGLCLCDRNAIITSKWKASCDSDRKYRSEWERLSCRKLLMD